MAVSMPIFKIGSGQFYRHLIGELLFHVGSGRNMHQSGTVWNEDRVRGNLFRSTTK